MTSQASLPFSRPTISTDIYPTRYAALDNPGHWTTFDPIDGLYRPCTADAKQMSVADLRVATRGGAMAVLYLPVQNEHYPEIIDGTYIEAVVNGSDYVVKCQHTRPTRERTQVTANLSAASRDEAIAAAERWISEL